MAYFGPLERQRWQEEQQHGTQHRKLPLRSQKPSSLSLVSVFFSVHRVPRGIWKTLVPTAFWVAVETMLAIFYRHTPSCASLCLLTWVICLADMNIGMQMSPESLPSGLGVHTEVGLQTQVEKSMLSFLGSRWAVAYRGCTRSILTSNLRVSSFFPNAGCSINSACASILAAGA